MIDGFLDHRGCHADRLRAVSTDDQNLDLQRDALRAAGCHKIYEDRMSGAKAARPGLAMVTEVARSGDVLTVWRLDRLGRSLHDLILLAEKLDDVGIGLMSLQEKIDTSSSGGKLIFHMFGALAEFERNLIRERTYAGLAAVRSHAAGGRASQKLLARLAIPASDNTILRHLKRHIVASTGALPIRVAGIDDWSWRKGFTYGTIIVDLQRRNVVDVLPVRSAKETAEWLAQHPGIEIVSRDRCGLYAQGIREGAPQAKQVADRFHLLQNLRESIERQMSNVSRFADRSLLAPVLGEHNNVSREAP